MLDEDLDDGRTEVITVSWWSSQTDIEGFVGQDISVAVLYPEDDDYLLGRETVTHYEVADLVTLPGRPGDLEAVGDFGPWPSGIIALDTEIAFGHVGLTCR